MDDEDRKRVHSLLVTAQGGPDKLEIFDVELTDKDVISSFSSRVREDNGKFVKPKLKMITINVARLPGNIEPDARGFSSPAAHAKTHTIGGFAAVLS